MKASCLRGISIDLELRMIWNITAQTKKSSGEPLASASIQKSSATDHNEVCQKLIHLFAGKAERGVFVRQLTKRMVTHPPQSQRLRVRLPRNLTELRSTSIVAPKRLVSFAT
jgi:hypothetical protein